MKGAIDSAKSQESDILKSRKALGEKHYWL